MKKIDSRSDLDLFLLFLSQLHKIRKRLAKVFIVSLAVLLLALAAGLWRHHNHAGWALRSASGTKLCPRRDEDVRNAVLFTQHGDMADDVCRRDIGSENDHSNGLCDGRVGGWNGAFAKGLDDLFDTSLEGFVDSGWHSVS